MNHAPGSPKANATNTLKKACFKVKSVMLPKAALSQTVIVPPPKTFRTKGAKLALYGSTKAKAAARTGSSANHHTAERRLIASGPPIR
jgi:hypothetical protein